MLLSWLLIVNHGPVVVDHVLHPRHDCICVIGGMKLVSPFSDTQSCLGQCVLEAFGIILVCMHG